MEKELSLRFQIKIDIIQTVYIDDEDIDAEYC